MIHQHRAKDEWPAPAMVSAEKVTAPEKYLVSWNKAGGRFWSADRITQIVVQILGTTPVDVS